MGNGSAPAICLERCSRGEEALYTVDGEVLLGGHNHTDDSDGFHTAEDLAGFSERTGVNLGNTEHNFPPRLTRGRWAPGKVAGIEVLTRETVDVVVLGNLTQVHALFEDCIRRKLRQSNPQYRPTGVSIHELVAAAQQHGLWVVHPHYASVEGLSILSRCQQMEVLGAARGRTFMECNAMVSRQGNELAGAVAEEWELPVLTTGDAHGYPHHHTGSYSAVARSLVSDDPTVPIVDRVMGALQTQNGNVRHQLYEPALMEKLQIGLQVAQKNGWRAISLYLAKAAGRVMGVVPKALRENIPARPRAAVAV